MVLSRIADALERIAVALETAAGLSRPLEEPSQADTVLYHDDTLDVIEELKREAYALRGGKPIAWDESLPEPPGKKADVARLGWTGKDRE